VTVLEGLSRRLISSVLIVGGLTSGGCLPTDDLAEYSEEWSSAFGGSGGSGSEQPAGNGGLGGADPTGMQLSDAGPLIADAGQGGSGGTSSTLSGDADAGLDAGATGLGDAAPGTVPDACADATPGSCGS
jgi:hypothetical protein